MWLSDHRAAASCRSFWDRPSLARFWLLGRSPARNSTVRRRQLPTEIEPAFSEGIKSLRCGLAGQPCELFKFGLVHAVRPSPVRSSNSSEGGRPDDLPA